MFCRPCQASAANYHKISKSASFQTNWKQVILCFDCPAHFGRMGPGILITLLRRRTDDIPCHLTIGAVTHALLKRLFHQPVLTGMEGQNGSPPAGLKHRRQLFQKGIQHLKFTVYINPQSLKASLAGFFDCFLLFPLRQEG